MNKKTLFTLSLGLFVALFYNFTGDISVSIFTLTVMGLSFYEQSKKKQMNSKFKLLFSGGVLFSLAYAYYGDFSSFLGIFITWHLLALLLFRPKIEWIKGLILIPLNYLMVLPLFYLNYEKRLQSKDKNKKDNLLFYRALYYVFIPVVICGLFLMIYAVASHQMENLLGNVRFDIDLAHGLRLLLLGTFFCLPFWFFKLPTSWQVVSHPLFDELKMSHSFVNQEKAKIFRKSGEITFLALNIILLIFIGIYGYENFWIEEFEQTVSANVHSRVNAVIFSIIMAISLISIYFRKNLNFDPNNKTIKKWVYIWLILNAVLISVTFIKNIHYIDLLGLTHKRLGVFAFLTLALVGLGLTYIKIKHKKTIYFLFHRFIPITYMLLMAASIVNWDYLITKYNIATQHIDNYYLQNQMKYNTIILHDYYLETHQLKHAQQIKRQIKNKKEYQDSHLLENNLYDYYIKNYFE